MKYKHALSAILLMLAAIQMPLAAQTFEKPEDATDNVLEPEQTPPGPLTEIVGRIFDAPEADAYMIRIVDPEEFEASTDGNERDTQLWLFDTQGYLIDWSDDISESNLASRLTGANLTEPGLYVLAITEYCYEPVDSEGDALISTVTPWAGWSTAGNVGMCDGGGSKAAPRIKMGGVLDLNYTILLTSVTGSTPQPTVLPADSLALVALYDATNGSDWLEQANWLTADVGSWFGIQVKDTRVSSIQLDENNLEGVLPEDIGALSRLESFSVRGNRLSGSIPLTLSTLERLATLELSDNELEGSLPESLAQLDSLAYFAISGNRISGEIPPAFGEMAALTHLDLGANALSGAIPPDLGNLDSLEVLVLGENQLSGSVPGELGGLTRLRRLEIHQNLVSGPLPASLTQLEHLDRLWFDETGVCVPADANFQDWLAGIAEVRGTDVLCAPGISMSPSALEFGLVSVGAAVDRTVTMVNTGTAAADVSVGGAAEFGADGFSFVSGNGFFTLEPNADREIVVRFEPLSAGDQTSALSIAYEGGGLTGDFSYPLSGTGTAPAIGIAPPELAFGEVTVGVTRELTLSVSNTGNAELAGSVAAEAGFAEGGFSFKTGEGDFALEPGSSTMITVAYRPGAAGGASVSLLISHNDPAEPDPIAVSITGTGVLPPAPFISVEPVSMDFGDVVVNSTAERTVTVSNLGPGLLQGSVSAGLGWQAAGFILLQGGGSFTLSSGESKSVAVRWTPGTIGARESSLVVSHAAVNASSPIRIPVAGRAVPPQAEISVAPPLLEFGSVHVGSSVERSFVVRHVGSSGRLVGMVDNGADLATKGFAFVSGAGAFDIGAGEQVEVRISFAPNRAGYALSQIRVSHNDPARGVDVVVPIAGEGIDPAQPAIDVMPAGLTFGDVAVGSTLDLPVVIKHVGSGSLAGEVLNPVPEAGFALISGGGAMVLAPGEMHVVTVRFRPTATAVAAANLQIAHNAPGAASPLVVPLIGSGSAPNAAPIAVADTVVTQFGLPVLVDVLANDFDPRGDPIWLGGLVTSPLRGVAVPRADGSILYTPFASFADGFDLFQYRITDGTFTGVGTVVVLMATVVSREVEQVAGGVNLEQNYPNPFNPSTRIRYTLERAGHTTLRVYDGVGRLVETLVDRVQSPGAHDVVFVAQALPSGSYFVVLEQDGVRRVRGMTLSK